MLKAFHGGRVTTPDERRRNLIWGRETLDEFSRDSSLPSSWREEAAQLLDGYPTVEYLQRFNAWDLAELDEYAALLMKARLLFLRVRTSADCSEQRRYSLGVVLRHFYG